MPINTHTKILATLGPASNSESKISELIDAGVDGFRLNFSHGTHDEHEKMFKSIRKVAKKKNAHIAIVADLQGPKLRIGKFKEEKVELKVGQDFVLDMKKDLGDNSRVTLPHKEIFEALKIGDKLLVNDGNIVLKVVKNGKNYADTVVEVGGVISSNKGVNLPNSSLNISALTKKDLDDLNFALKLGIDCVCLSFVQKLADVKEARKIIGDKAWIISKLEKPQAIDDVDNIIKASDMIMVARGDLGVECPVETVPVLQKHIVERCRQHGKPVIVATQMLESMISSPMPTRAEVSDVANAVYDGVDVVMLSAETAAGKYPIEAVKVMAEIAETTEDDVHYDRRFHNAEFRIKNSVDAISHSTCGMAIDLNAKAIVACSLSGMTARMVSRFRSPVPILGLTTDERTWRRLALSWGVIPAMCERFSSTDVLFYTAKKIAEQELFLDKGDKIIITGGDTSGTSGNTSLIKIENI